MIINIRGTSGSGKSSLVRTIMNNPQYGPRQRFHVAGRKQPIGYVLGRSFGRRSLAVVGHYETDCGGCDTISKMEDIFAKVREAHGAGFDVLFEGLLISADVNRAAALHQDGLPLVVVGLDKVPLETCIASINERRRLSDERRIISIEHENADRRANGRKEIPLPEPRGPVNPKNTESKFKGVKQSMARLVDLGVEVHSCDRAEALAIILRLLELEGE